MAANIPNSNNPNPNNSNSLQLPVSNPTPPTTPIPQVGPGFQIFAPTAPHPDFIIDVKSQALRERAYNAEALAKAICDSLHPDPAVSNRKDIMDFLDPAQRQLMESVMNRQYATLKLAGPDRGNIMLENAAIHDLATEFFPILNVMLFGGSLTGYVQGISAYDFVTLKAQEPNADAVVGNALGFYEKDTRTIHLRRDPPIMDLGNTEVQIYLSVMIHEMVHAFFWAWTCTCATRCAQDEIMANLFGKTFHGVAWVQVMHTICEALQRDMNWKIDAGIAHSVQMEEAKSGFKIPNEILQSWNLFRINFDQRSIDLIPKIWYKGFGRCPLRFRAGIDFPF